MPAIGLPGRVHAAADGDVFGLGVASGCMGPDRVLLWTRLVAPPDRPAAGPGIAPVPVR